MSADTTPPITLTNKTGNPHAPVGVMGDIDQLRAAYDADQPVTLSGKLAGETVYLGHRRQVMGDDGITVERLGMVREVGPVAKFPGHTIAVFYADLSRLDGAPTLAEMRRNQLNAQARHEAEVMARVAEEDERLENLAEDGA